MNSQENSIIDYFSSLKRLSTFGPAYIFLGKNEDLIMILAKIAACREGVYCGKCWDCLAVDSKTHPDLMIIEAAGVEIKIDQIREAIKFLFMKSYCAARKVLIIKDAQRLNDKSANAFLKTLEQPPSNSIIFILAESLDGMLPTISSRCRKIFVPTSQESLDLASAQVIKSFLAGEKIKFLNRKHFLQFLTTFSLLLRDKIVLNLTANNRLLGASDYEIILPSWDVEKLSRILEKTISMQSIYNSVNENLALNLIRMEILC